MEVDDDFGDLYSDVLIPTIPSDSRKSPSPPSNPNPSSGQGLAPSPPVATTVAATSAGGTTPLAAAPAVAVDDDDWLLGGAAAPTVDPISNWADEDEEIDANPSKDEKPRASTSSSDKTVQGMDQTAATADVADQEEPQAVIPGLEAAVGPTESDDWDDSDSDDDLKIVLNDPEHGAMDDLGYGDGDEEEALGMGANGDQIGALDQDWGEEGAGPGGEGEGKEGDASKVIGAGGTGGAGPSRIGYSSHGFHQHHSVYKVRDACLLPEMLL